ncbi:MAG: hypothetical protein FWH59_01430, partial [Lentimicrobiaceae bacterium]|nr:hypothetical protein [Lentimicrobiaceae bacterium]
MKKINNTPNLLKAIFSGLCLVAFVFGAVTQLQARTFLANDYASYKVAVDEINANNSGADTIRIVGDILAESNLVIKGDVTIIGDTNSDGTPKYTVDCSEGRIVQCEIQNYCTIENVRVIKSNYNGIAVTMGSGVNDCNVKINNCIITDTYS